MLELEAHADHLGTARIAIDLRDWGEHCLVTIDEHPLQGTGGTLHNMGLDVVIQLRLRVMLARLARRCENQAQSKDQDQDGDRPRMPPANGAGGPDD